MGIAAHLDQVFDDVKPENVSKFDSQAVDEDLPGLGQHYCVHCRYLLLLLLLLLLPLFHLLLWIDLSFFPRRSVVGISLERLRWTLTFCPRRTRSG